MPQPVGVFDSGVGGLTVAVQICRHLPGESIIYFGDTLHVPYGSRSPSQLVAFACRIAEFLVGQGAKVVVDACNSTSAVALDALLARSPVPVIGVIEPGVKEALRQTRNGRIGILGTQVTINSDAHRRSLLAKEPETVVYPQACPLLVPLVEAAEVASTAARDALTLYLTPMLQAGVDTIILGCTHYPFLAPLVQEIAGDQVNLVDPAEATAVEVAALLHNSPSAHTRCTIPHHTCLVSGSAGSFAAVGRQLLGDHPLLAEIRQVELEWSEAIE